MRAKSSAEVFRLRGEKRIGIWTRPLRRRPAFPAVLFLHGFPGSEKNVDVQRMLLKRGVASFALHFGGAWGSEGVYRFSRLIEEARAGWRFMRRLPGVDRRRTAAFGFSMGGWTALHLSALEPAVRAVCAVAPAGGMEMIRPGLRQRLLWLSRPLRTLPPAELYRDFAAALSRFDPAVSVARRRCPLLLIHGSEDEVVPPAISRRLYALAAGPKRLLIRPGSRHDFLESRDWLARRVSSWLARELLARPARLAPRRAGADGTGPGK